MSTKAKIKLDFNTNQIGIEHLNNIKLVSGFRNRQITPNKAPSICVMQAVAWFAGEIDTDTPKCTDSVITDTCIDANDYLNDKERQKLKKVIPLIAQTKNGVARAKRLSQRNALIAEVLGDRYPLLYDFIYMIHPSHVYRQNEYEFFEKVHWFINVTNLFNHRGWADPMSFITNGDDAVYIIEKLCLMGDKSKSQKKSAIIKKNRG